MFGYILRLDADRQKRVGTNQLQKLLKPEVYEIIKLKENKLNSARDGFSPFAPTIVRPSFYPSFLRATDIRTIFWKVKNNVDFHDLKRIYVDPESNLVFEFYDQLTKEKVEKLVNLMLSYSHIETVLKDWKGKVVTFEFKDAYYEESIESQKLNTGSK